MAKKLDIIITHYKEPWETGEKAFKMLAMQRDVDLSDIRVIIIQDGMEGSLPWNECIEGYPFDIKVQIVDHGGISRARNTGLIISDAEWIIFCDFDDMFSSIHSLRRFFDSMGDDVDLIYSYIRGEESDGPGPKRLELYMDNDVFIHGKMFRRSFLVDNNLFFEPDVHFSEDTLFCRVMGIVLNPYRKREIPEILYTRCWYDGSVCRNFENNFYNAVSLFRARKALIREYHDHGCMKNYTASIIKTALDYYYAITSGGYPDPEWFEEDFWQFWERYSDEFESAPIDLVMYENDISVHEAIHKGFVTIPSVTFWQWLDSMRVKFSAGGVCPDTETVYPRIAVYHATRNMYDDMYAALKSLVIHTNVEKVYLLIEDDEFPYEVPDFVDVINVSDQKYILPSSPNYNCCWTWMVMLRAAFPKIFPQHDVILSLDVDALVNMNIDDIWNTDLTDCYYAAAKEAKASELYGKLYTNMGVCLLNLKKLRDDRMDDAILEELNTVEHPFTEQDVFNEFCIGHKMTISSDYNASAYTAHANTPRICHYAGFKEKNFPEFARYRTEPWPASVTLKDGVASRLNESGDNDE